MAKKTAKSEKDLENILLKEIRDSKQKIQKLRSTIKAKFNLPQLQLNIDAKDAAQTLQSELEKLLRQVELKYLQIIKQDLSVAITAKLLQYDLVDTGALRDSLNVTIEQDSIVVSYNVPYANLMHYGGYIRPYGNSHARLVYLPGRPWVEDALDGYDYESAYLRAFAEV